MKVLGLSGSMRKDGNTALLIQKILDHVDAENCSEIETEFVSLSGMEILPCIGCEKCKEKKWCIIEKDDWGRIVDKVLDCDILIIGSPTYYYDVCGQLKNFIDRTYSLYHDRKLAGRNAVVVAVCADRGCERTLETLEGFVNTHEFSYLGFVAGKGYMPGDILNDPHAMPKAKEVAGTIIKMLRKDSKYIRSV
ncbi:MAG: NADPH-dependent FMN reductase [Methanoculleus sp. SDB]|nr:MAG: NADPH-dependent FMN reductase [Methanoculleus sp. SDB]